MLVYKIRYLKKRIQDSKKEKLNPLDQTDKAKIKDKLLWTGNEQQKMFKQLKQNSQLEQKNNSNIQENLLRRRNLKKVKTRQFAAEKNRKTLAWKK